MGGLPRPPEAPSLGPRPGSRRRVTRPPLLAGRAEAEQGTKGKFSSRGGVGRGSRAPLFPAGLQASGRASAGGAGGGRELVGVGVVWPMLQALLSAMALPGVGSRSLTVNLRTGFRPVTARPFELVHLTVWAHPGPAACVGQAGRF